LCDRLPTSEATHSFAYDGSHKCSMNNAELAVIKPATDVCCQSKPTLQFVVPTKHTAVNDRNERQVYDEHSAHMNVARPVVMQTLTRTQSSSDKCSCTSSNSKLSDWRCICISDRSSIDLSHSILKGQNFDVSSFDPNSLRESEVKASLVADDANYCVVKNDNRELIVKDVIRLQQVHTDANISNDVTVISHLSEMDKNSSLSYLSERVVDTSEKPYDLSFAKDTVRTQRLFCTNNQLERIASKTRQKNAKASPGSLLTLRSSDDCSRLSLKDAVGGTRPFTYSLLEVTF